nr:ethylene-responsive transcription factor ERF110-like [Lolium perenne]
MALKTANQSRGWGGQTAPNPHSSSSSRGRKISPPNLPPLRRCPPPTAIPAAARLPSTPAGRRELPHSRIRASPPPAARVATFRAAAAAPEPPSSPATSRTSPSQPRRPASPPTPAAPTSACARAESAATPPRLRLRSRCRCALPRSSTGYHDVRLRLSGWWGTEITRGVERFWLGTFDSEELAARAYDIMVWRYDGAAGPRNFFDVDNLAVAEFMAPKFSVVTRAEERAVRREYMWMSIRNRDEAEMAAFCAAHPQHVAEELEFYAQLEAQRAATAAARPSSSSAPPPTIVVDDSSDDDDPDWIDKMVAELEAEEAAEDAAKKAAEDGDSSDFDEDFWDKPYISTIR